MSQESIDELYDKWEAEYQKRAALIHELESLCATWAQANRDVTAFYLPAAPSINAIAHMTERRKCESALEDIIRKAKGE
jgi:hypothetical protein